MEIDYKFTKREKQPREKEEDCEPPAIPSWKMAPKGFVWDCSRHIEYGCQKSLSEHEFRHYISSSENALSL